jgi:hypothetical protein
MAFDNNDQRLQSQRQFSPTTPYRDVQMRIGEAMRQHFELPQELPDQLLALLMQVAGEQENN